MNMKNMKREIVEISKKKQRNSRDLKEAYSRRQGSGNRAFKKRR
jgi:hypothetical protein